MIMGVKMNFFSPCDIQPFQPHLLKRLLSPSSCLGAFVKNQLFKYPSLSGPICLPLPSTILSWLLQIHSKSSKKEGQVLQPCCYFKRLLWWFQTLCLCVTILEPARLFL